jgi:hypothetical protein
MRGHHLPVDAKEPRVRLTWAALREAAQLFAYLLPYRRKFIVAHLSAAVRLFYPT